MKKINALDNCSSLSFFVALIDSASFLHIYALTTIIIIVSSTTILALMWNQPSKVSVILIDPAWTGKYQSENRYVTGINVARQFQRRYTTNQHHGFKQGRIYHDRLDIRCHIKSTITQSFRKISLISSIAFTSPFHCIGTRDVNTEEPLAFSPLLIPISRSSKRCHILQSRMRNYWHCTYHNILKLPPSDVQIESLKNPFLPSWPNTISFLHSVSCQLKLATYFAHSVAVCVI